MSRVFKNGWFQRFARKQRLSDAALVQTVGQAEAGLIDADLGGGLIKQRVARSGGGKSGGFRTLIFFRSGDRAIFAFGFAKNDLANISAADLKLLKEAAGEALRWSDEDLDRLVEAGALMEIDHDKKG
jgi:hypothetical protein